MNPIIDELKKDPDFDRFIRPVDENQDFRDAVYFLRDDGTFIFSEGYYHQVEKPRKERRLNSHIFYVPILPGRNIPDYARKEIFGREYENTTKEIMTTRELGEFYSLQLKRYIEADPAQSDLEKPVYARYKAMVPVTSLVCSFPHRNSLRAIMGKADVDPNARDIKIIAEQTADLLGIDISRLGISGSLSLGNYAHPHDLDFVIYAPSSEVRRIVRFMYSLTDREDKRKVYEFGKFWPLRFWDWADNNKFMVCPFFSYLDPEEAPLRNFDCEDLGPARVTACISDDTHNSFSPSVLMLEDVKLGDKDYPPITRLIIYHGAERGDWREGDRVLVEGRHVRITTYRVKDKNRELKEEFEAVLEDNLGDVKRLN